MSKLFNNCSVMSGQKISHKRQTKKDIMRGEGLTGKQVRRMEKEARRCQ